MDKSYKKNNYLIESINAANVGIRNSDGAGTDINEADTGLSDFYENFGFLPGASSVGLVITNPKGQIISVNKTVKDLLKITDAEALEMNVTELYANQGDRLHMLNMLAESKTVHDFEVEVRDKNGALHTMLANIDFIEFDNTHLLLTALCDITQRKKSQKIQLAANIEYKDLFIHAPVGISVVDFQGNLIINNNAVVDLLGYSEEELNDVNAQEFYLIPEVRRQLLELTKSLGNVRDFETVFKRRDGSRMDVLINTDIIEFNGRKNMLLTSIRDISKLKRAEEELQKANRKLASWVGELQERTEEMRLMNEMGEQLQSCQTVSEACAISARYVQRICPASHGALYLIGESKNIAEAAEMWGEPVLTQEVFDPLSCWAIRSGRLHLVDESRPGLLCGHITGPQYGQYLCVPLMVNGKVIGILHLNHVDMSGPELPEPSGLSYTDHKAQIITTIAGHIALAISNLRLKETLRQQSIRDALTGLFNRRYMEETLERELLRSKREDNPVSLIMIDIDYFKEFNDREGHGGGNALLRELGAFLVNSTRGGDVACRYGGEEFLMVLPDANLENAARRAEEMRLGVKELKVNYLGKILAKCSISLGVAVFPENGETSEVLLKAADNALYRAKNEGRDRVVLA